MANATIQLVPIPMIYSTMALSAIGAAGNILIVWATLISTALQNRCQILIAILAASDAVVCVYLVQLRVLMFQGWYFVPNRECYQLSLHGLFALNVQAGMGLLLGVDRLLAVSKPMKYPQISKWIYAGMLFAVVLFSLIITGAGYLDITDDPVAVCLPPTAYTARARSLWVATSFIIAILVLLVYSAAHVKCKSLSANSTHGDSIERIRRLLNSLSLVVAIYFFTWFLTIAALLATVLLPLSPALIQGINQQLAWLVIINSSTNFFIYLERSREYRKAFFYIITFGCSIHPNKETPRPLTIVSNVATANRSSVVRMTR